jgi:hypothetical protein
MKHTNFINETILINVLVIFKWECFDELTRQVLQYIMHRNIYELSKSIFEAYLGISDIYWSFMEQKSD